MVKICIAGKNNIAVDALSFLLDHNVKKEEIVVTCNRSKRGGLEWQKSLSELAGREGIREVELSEVYEMQDVFFLSLEYDRLVKPDRFSTDNLFNIHFSMLPRYKGLYTSAMVLLNNESETGVTFHRIDHGIDTGNIIEQRAFEIDSEDTCRDVYQKYILHGTELCKEVLDRYFLKKEKIASVPQDPMHSTYYGKKAIDYENLLPDLNQTGLGIKNQVRAFFFPEYQVLRIYGKPISRAVITDKRSREKPGTLLETNEEKMTIASIDYDVELFYYEGE